MTCKVLPVIHVSETRQVLRNVDIVLKAEADGVFLVNHDKDWQHLQRVVKAVQDFAPDLWLGINSLDLHPKQAFGFFKSVDGIWTDNGGIDERSKEQPHATMIRDARANYDGLYFGGVAFKYQRPVYNVVGAAEIATDYMDVVTTVTPITDWQESINYRVFGLAEDYMGYDDPGYAESERAKGPEPEIVKFLDWAVEQYG